MDGSVALMMVWMVVGPGQVMVGPGQVVGAGQVVVGSMGIGLNFLMEHLVDITSVIHYNQFIFFLFIFSFCC